MTALFTIITRDAEGSENLRQEYHQQHLQHFRNHHAQIAVAGPLFSDDGSSAGSLVILKATSSEEAEDFIKGDPFHSAGVWQDIEILPFKAASGEWAEN